VVVVGWGDGAWARGSEAGASSERGECGRSGQRRSPPVPVAVAAEHVGDNHADGVLFRIAQLSGENEGRGAGVSAVGQRLRRRVNKGGTRSITVVEKRSSTERGQRWGTVDSVCMCVCVCACVRACACVCVLKKRERQTQGADVVTGRATVALAFLFFVLFAVSFGILSLSRNARHSNAKKICPIDRERQRGLMVFSRTVRRALVAVTQACVRTNTNTNTHTHTHTHTHTYICTHTHTYTCIHIQAHMHAFGLRLRILSLLSFRQRAHRNSSFPPLRPNIHTYIHTTHTHIHTHINIHIDTRANTYTHTHTHTHTYSQTQTHNT